MLNIFKKSSKPKSKVDKHKLYMSMRDALRQYTQSLREYQVMSGEYGTDSSIATVFYAQLDHHRTEYYLLRLEYETAFGDVEEYKNSVHRTREWSINTGVNLLMKPVLMRWRSQQTS